MSVLSHPSLGASLDALECHFTWELVKNRSQLLRLRDILEDIGTEAGNLWLGYIYNLQAYIHFQLGFQEKALGSTVGDALRCFGNAAEAFRQVRNTVSEEGPWLLVNYGNLAWLHYHMGEQAKSLEYVGKVEVLLQEYPAPIQEEVHQEVLAEKAFTLMHFSQDGKLKAVEYFTKAIEMKPDMVEWTTSRALALLHSFTDPSPAQQATISETLKDATEGHPDNLYIAVMYLKRCAETSTSLKTKREIEHRARALAERVLRQSQSTYSGIKPLIRMYREYVSFDEAIDVAKEALARHPTKRHLKACLADCYKWKIFSDRDGLQIQSLRDRAIELHKEVIQLYPYNSFQWMMSLAGLYALSTHHDKMDGDKIFKELLKIDLEPPQLQKLYHKYAQYLNFSMQDQNTAIDYHIKAAEIPHPSRIRTNSMRILTQIKNRKMNQRCGEIEVFLAKVQPN